MTLAECCGPLNLSVHSAHTKTRRVNLSVHLAHTKTAVEMNGHVKPHRAIGRAPVLAAQNSHNTMLFSLPSDAFELTFEIQIFI